MSLIMFETTPLLEQGVLNLTFNLKTNIQVTAKRAQQLVSVFVGNQIADLLHGDLPNLVIREEGAYWRVPVVLSSHSLGRIGLVGTIDVHVETGKLQTNDRIIREIEQKSTLLRGM
ncbi:hypothetical protein QUF58_09075 [Anaerolineales bacterium HSG24]|nr:hypothetical protein [Anaerolineales bacterium HSG24]